MVEGCFPARGVNVDGLRLQLVVGATFIPSCLGNLTFRMCHRAINLT
jgi:hypothetical protein